MKAVVYCEGRAETAQESGIISAYGKVEIDPAYNFPTYEVEFSGFNEVFKLCKKLNLNQYKTYLPDVNGDLPIIVFSLDKKSDLE
jgi:hypothetical protein